MLRLQRFIERSDRWGYRRAVNWQIMHLLARFIGFHLHYVFVGSGSGRTGRMGHPAVPEGYRARMVGLEDLRPYATSVPGLSQEFLETVFATGDICVATFLGDELVGFSFQSTGRSRVTNQLDILIPEGFRYTYKTWIAAEHRGRNLSQLQNYVRHHSRRRDHDERGIWYVETHNYPSLLHSYRHPRDRALRMGFIGWFTLFGREIPFRTPAARWLGVELARKEDTRLRQYL